MMTGLRCLLLVAFLASSSAFVGSFGRTAQFGRQNVLSAVSPFNNKPADSDKLFTAFKVCKDKAAFCVKAIPPTFSNGRYKSLSRTGTMFFEFAPLAQKSKQYRQYDWARKFRMSLSVAECGDLLLVEPGVSHFPLFIRDFTYKGECMSREPTYFDHCNVSCAAPQQKGVAKALKLLPLNDGSTG